MFGRGREIHNGVFEGMSKRIVGEGGLFSFGCGLFPYILCVYVLLKIKSVIGLVRLLSRGWCLLPMPTI